MEMTFFLIWLFIGFAIGFFLFGNMCKNLREVYKMTFSYFKYIFPFFTLLAIIIILLFSIIYYFIIYHFDPHNPSFFDCIILSIVGFFSLIDFDKYRINGIFKIVATFEYYLYIILFAILIGILLNKAIEDDKERKWEPIKYEAYKEIDRLSNIIKSNIVSLLNYRASIVFDFDGNHDEKWDEKLDNAVDDFIKKIKLYSIKDIEIIKDEIKYKIKVNKIEYEINESKFKDCNWGNIFKSLSSELSILQIKYQQYMEPKITNNIIKIQTNLNLAEDTISAYDYNNGILQNSILQVKNDDLIRDIVFYLSKAAELSLEASEQSKKQITLLGKENYYDEKEKD